MTPLSWLVDKSALWRLEDAQVGQVILGRMTSGAVGVSIVTELEMGFSARSSEDYALMRQRYLDELPAVPLPFRAEERAREVQLALVQRGHHRSAGVADLLIAATAEVEGLTLLHYDADFDLIAEVTAQPMEWVVPRGSI